jgi:hypothetical protein
MFCLFAKVTASGLFAVADQKSFPVWANEKPVKVSNAKRSNLFFIIEIVVLVKIGFKNRVIF